jgi:hypothetical protein
MDMAIKEGTRICAKFVRFENGVVGTRNVDEVHEHCPPFPTRVVKGRDLPNCIVLDTGNSSRGKNVLHLYYGREQQQHELSAELLRRGKQLLRVMWVVGTIMVLDILRRL